MGRSFEGHPGGIRRLRNLLEGEHGGALWADLWTRGFKPDHAGTVGHSWYDMRVLIEHGMPNDGTSALFRSINPDDWMWASLDSRLLAEMATIVSDLRFFKVASLVEGDIPEEFGRVKYGPRVEPPAEEDGPAKSDSVENARAVAAQIRAEMSGAA